MIDMHSLYVLWVSPSTRSDNIRTPVSALNHILLVPKLQHHLVHDFCILLVFKASFPQIRRKPKAREGWRNYIEARLIQEWQYLADLCERPGPAMDEEQWLCGCSRRPRVYEVDIKGPEPFDINWADELWKVIKLGLFFPPIVVFAPKVDRRAD